MNWDTLFHKEQDAFRKQNGKLPKVLYVGDTERRLYQKWCHDADEGVLSYGGVPVIWVRKKVYFRFHL